MKASLVIKALSDAYKERRPPPGLIFHSDCGGEYKSKKFRSRLKRYNIKQSMTYAGNCYDNATAESFFGTLKSELIQGKIFETWDEATSSVFEYIEVFYNRIRLHSSLGYQSSVQYEEKNVA